jgi:hypothetical protein
MPLVSELLFIPISQLIDLLLQVDLLLVARWIGSLPMRVLDLPATDLGETSKGSNILNDVMRALALHGSLQLFPLLE